MSSSAGQGLVSLERAWQRLMRVVGFANPSRAGQSQRARAALIHLMRRG